MLNLPSSFSSRRSHLDSASYRTLLRIFSLCLDDSQSLNPNPNPNPSPSSDSDSNGNSKPAEELGRGEAEKGPAFADGPNPNSQSAEGCGDCGVEKGAAFTTNSNLQAPNNVDTELELELDDDDIVDTELLQGIVSDCAKLIDGDDTLGQIGLDDLEVNNQEKDVNFEKGTITEARLETDPSPLVSECIALRDEMRNNSDESKHGDESKVHGECGEAVEGVAFEKSIIVEKTREINSSDGEDFEDGEIPNDSDNSNQSLDSEPEPAGQEDKKFEEWSLCQSFDENQNRNYTLPVSSNINFIDGVSRTKENYLRNSSSSTLSGDGKSQGLEAFGEPEEKKSCGDAAKAGFKCRAADHDTLGLSSENTKNLANKEKEKPSETELVEVQVKKKRPPLSEERKAKKKKAKKRKKAQKERQEGVKRLKLQPITKPKEVKLCDFYKKGRCQKGDSCKFSHDTIPITKNQPCIHFARNSCLKGDDCPYDHELSKYPCHNYMTEGMCYRGDGCKFSHKLPATEGSSPASVASKADPRLSSGKSNSVKQLHMNRTMTGTIGQPKSSAASSSQFTKHRPGNSVIAPKQPMQMPAGNSVKPPKQPMQIPSGLRFLSFGKGPCADANNKLMGNQQKQEKALAAGHKNFPSAAQKSLAALQSQKTMKPNTPAENAASTTTNACTKSNERSLQSEVTEASKLLEEFLFSGTC